MLSVIMGAGAFVLFLLYDINSFLWQARLPKGFFFAGVLLIGISAVLDIRSALSSGAFSGGADLLLLAGSLICFVALIYCLFFALPFDATYQDPKNGRHVYDGGVYALCRHPGILCFGFMYFLLGAAALPEVPLVNCLLLPGLNLLYAWFQDRITFPKTFCDYTSYQKTVPFLIPTGASIRMAINTLSPTDREEDKS